MIEKDKAPGGNPTPEDQNGLTKYKSYSYLNLSVVSLEDKILNYLLEHHGWISTKRLFEKLALDILEINQAARAIHNLGRRGIVEIKANALRAARGIRRVEK